MTDTSETGLEAGASVSTSEQPTSPQPLQEQDTETDSDITPARQTSKVKSYGRRSRGKQGRLDFSNHLGWRSEEGDTETPSGQELTSRTTKGAFGSSARKKQVLGESSGLEESAVKQGSPLKISRSARNGKIPAVQISSESEEKQQPKSTRKLRSAKLAPAVISDDDEDATPVRKTRSKTAAGSTISNNNPKWSYSKSGATQVDSDEDDDGLDIVGAPGDKSTEPNLGEPETSGDEVIRSSPTKRARIRKQRTRSAYDEDEEDDDLPVSPHRRARPNQKQDMSSDEDEDDVVVASSRKRQSNQRKPSHQEEVSENELEWLKSSPPKPSAKKEPSARQAALERLKRKRAGQNGESTRLQSSGQQRRRRTLHDSESESDNEPLVVDNEVSDEDFGVEDQAANAHDMLNRDEYDEDFVIEDDDDTIGVPTDMQMPLAFTFARKKAKDLFKFAVEWMVQKQLNPGFASGDEVYGLAFQKLDDEVRGLAGSKFTSSAWKQEFTWALNARPNIGVTELSGAARTLLEHGCEACGRSNHPATYGITFSGKPYDPHTLEELENDDEDDEDDEDDGAKPDWDIDGHEILSADKVYNVGKFCMKNAETAHTLKHWKYHLNDWTVDWLKEEGHLDPENVVERVSWNTKRRGKYANKVVDEMESTGEIKRLYRDYKLSIDNARESKLHNGRWDRGDD